MELMQEVSYKMAVHLLSRDIIIYILYENGVIVKGDTFTKLRIHNEDNGIFGVLR